MVSSLNSTTLWIAGAAAIASCVLTAAARRVAPRLGLMDCPDGRRKSHAGPMPLMGGVAIFLAFAGALIGIQLSSVGWLAADPGLARRTWVLLVTAGMFCAVGLWDDKYGMRARTKLLALTIASLPFALMGQVIEQVHLLGVHVEFGVFGVAFTVFWLVACANVINLVDGLDGLAGTIGFIVCLSIGALSVMQGKTGPAALALLAAASLLGFLVHNWPPARIFLGDSGSLMIGFIIGALSIESTVKTATGFALAIPLVLVSIPVFDTFMAIVRRKLTGRGIGEADRGHIHHCLQDLGLSRKQSLLAITGLCVSMAGISVFAVWTNNELAALTLCLGLLGLLILGRVFGYRETMLFLRHVQALGYFLVDASGMVRTRFLLAQIAPNTTPQPADSWDQLTHHLRRMGGTRLELQCHNTGSAEPLSQLSWESDVWPASEAALWQFSYTVRGSDGVDATLTASGHSRRRLKGQPMIDLFRLFDHFCAHWLRAHHEAPQPKDTRSPVIALPAPAFASNDERRVA